MDESTMGGAASFQLGRFLFIAGIILVCFGLILMAGSRVSFWGLGRLPGDIVYRGRNFKLYFPLVTCLIASAVLTAIFWIISLLTRR
jgi:hypothetical protein